LREHKPVAKVAVHTIKASTAIETRQSSAIVDVGLTLRTRITEQAVADEAIDSVLASSAVSARVGIAFVNVGLTARARESRKTV
jgi:hypothetical protein